MPINKTTPPGTEVPVTAILDGVGGFAPYTYDISWLVQPDPNITFAVSNNNEVRISVGAEVPEAVYTGTLHGVVTDSSERVRIADLPVTITVAVPVVYQPTYFMVGNWLTTMFPDPLLVDAYRDPAVFTGFTAQNEPAQGWIDSDSEDTVRYHVMIQDPVTKTPYGFRSAVRPLEDGDRVIGNVGAPDPWQKTEFQLVDLLGDPDTTSSIKRQEAWAASGNGVYVIAPGENTLGEPVIAYTCPFGSTTLTPNAPNIFPGGFNYRGYGVVYLPQHQKFFAVVGRVPSGVLFTDFLFCSSSDGINWTLDSVESAPAGDYWATFLGLKEYREGRLAFNTYSRDLNTFANKLHHTFYQDETGAWLRSDGSAYDGTRYSIIEGPDGIYTHTGTTLYRYASITDLTTPLESWGLSGRFNLIRSIAYNPDDPNNRIMIAGGDSFSPNGVIFFSQDLTSRTTSFYADPGSFANSPTQIIPPKIFNG